MANNSNKLNIPEARDAMNRFKMESASEVGVNLKQGYNQMVKKMIEAYENGLK